MICDYLRSNAAERAGESCSSRRTNDISGYKIVRYLGVVRGITVRSRNVVTNFVASLHTLMGGNITAYTTLAEHARQEAFDNLFHPCRAGRRQCGDRDALRRQRDIARRHRGSGLRHRRGGGKAAGIKPTDDPFMPLSRGVTAAFSPYIEKPAYPADCSGGHVGV